MKYIKTPIAFSAVDSGISIERRIEEHISKIDNLVELIVFTPRGSFPADPDFGFEYWNHEFSNVNYREFNNDYRSDASDGSFNDFTKKECQESVRQSLAVYEPLLKQVNVSIEMNLAESEIQDEKKVVSKYMLTVIVEGELDEGLGTTCAYRKEVKFLIEPTTRKYKI